MRRRSQEEKQRRRDNGRLLHRLLTQGGGARERLNRVEPETAGLVESKTEKFFY